MLLVDRVEIIEAGLKCRGIKNVTINEPFFQGHYPGFPIMPGVLIIESMAQVGAVMMLHAPQFRGRIPLIGAIEAVKFRKPVVPGDQLVVDLDVLWMRGTAGKCHAEGSVDGQAVASFDMVFKLIPAPGPEPLPTPGAETIEAGVGG